jgi:hypothetical protein
LNSNDLLKSFLLTKKKGASTPLDKRSIIVELEAERDRLNSAITALQSSHRNAGRGKATATATNGRKGRRHLSAAARKKISDAQKARWAARKKKA